MKEVARRNQVRIYDLDLAEIEEIIRIYLEQTTGEKVKILLEREQCNLGETVTVLVE